MVQVKKLEEIGKKWSEVTPTRAPYFEAGVRAPRKDWAESAIAANDAWKAGVQEAVTQDRFARGVSRVGTSKWQRKTIEVGVPRWSDGVRKAAPDYIEGFKPYHETLAALTLPPRGARGDPKNIDRVRAIAQALHKKKIELGK